MFNSLCTSHLRYIHCLHRLCLHQLSLPLVVSLPSTSVLAASFSLHQFKYELFLLHVVNASYVTCIRSQRPCEVWVTAWRFVRPWTLHHRTRVTGVCGETGKLHIYSISSILGLTRPSESCIAFGVTDKPASSWIPLD